MFILYYEAKENREETKKERGGKNEYLGFVNAGTVISEDFLAFGEEAGIGVR